MYLLTGSSSAILPRSTSIIAATLVTVFVTECSGKIVSGVIVDTGVDIALAEPLEIDRLAMPLDQQDGAGNFSGRRLFGEEVVDAREFFRRQRRARPRAEIGG